MVYKLPYCMRCGEKLPHEARFCPSCGAPVKPIIEKKSVKGKVLLIAVGVFILLLIIEFSTYRAPREVGPTSTLTIQIQTFIPPSPTKPPSKLTKVWEYKVDWAVEAVAISPDGNYIAASGDKLVFLTSDGKVLWEKDVEAVTDIAVSMNGTYILVGDVSYL